MKSSLHQTQCIICVFFSFYSNPRSNIDACCDCSELEMKMCHLFHNPWQDSILSINPCTIRNGDDTKKEGRRRDRSRKEKNKRCLHDWIFTTVLPTYTIDVQYKTKHKERLNKSKTPWQQKKTKKTKLQHNQEKRGNTEYSTSQLNYSVHHHMVWSAPWKKRFS